MRLRYLLLLCFSLILSLWLGTASPCPAFAAPLTWDANAQGQFVTSLCQDTTGHVWIGTEDNGVWRCDPTAPAGQQYTHYTTKDGLGDDNAYALTCDKAGRVWVGTLNHGVSVFNGKAWRTYGPVDGPLGSRVFALAVSPRDGGVWGATEAGLFRYAHSRWTYFTRAEGLPSDQAQALAFAPDGTLYVGTQCDGIAVGSPEDNYKTWRVTPGPAALPNTAAGRGLPSALINCLLVTADNTVFAGTTTGLAKSRDGGETWTFVRGLDWKAKLAGLYHPIAPAPSTYTGDLLTEDYVTALAEDERGRLFVGHRQTGVEAFAAKTGKRLQSGASGAKTDAYAFCLLVSGKSAWVGQYSGGLLPPADMTADAEAAPVPSSEVASLPVPAPPPTIAELNKMLAKVKLLKTAMPDGSAKNLGEDWQTQGDWLGRYGRQYAHLCAMDHLITCTDAYSVEGIMGNHHKPNDGMRWWTTWMQTDNPKSLYTPVSGVRRQSEWDDHGEDYPQTFTGPDLWVRVQLAVGDVHRISLYFMNKDGHDGENRYRDYLIEVKPYRKTLESADAAPTLASARVHDFWGGVYEQFAVKSPGDYYIKVSKNYSHNTILSAVLIDNLTGQQTFTDTEPLAYMNQVRYEAPPAEMLSGKNPAVAAAKTLWDTLDGSYNFVGGIDTQTADRLGCYRAVQSAGNQPSLLANWQWHLPLWTPDQRQQFAATMSRSFHIVPPNQIRLISNSQ